LVCPACVHVVEAGRCLLVSSVRPEAGVVAPEVHEEHGLCIIVVLIPLHFCFYAISCLSCNCRCSFLVMQEFACCCSGCHHYQPACMSTITGAVCVFLACKVRSTTLDMMLSGLWRLSHHKARQGRSDTTCFWLSAADFKQRQRCECFHTD